jgi:hypothetical protein
MERSRVLQKHIGEMLALERHILGAVDRQRATDRLAVMPEAGTTVLTIDRMFAKHVDTLENYLQGSGSDQANGIANAFTRMTGTVAGLYGRLREQPVSRMLRDDYVALNLAAISYEMLHTAGLAHHEMQIAQIALIHLQDITPQIVDLSRIIPRIVAAEIAQTEGGDASVGIEAEKNTHRAWTHDLHA